MRSRGKRKEKINKKTINLWSLKDIKQIGIGAIKLKGKLKKKRQARKLKTQIRGGL